MTEGPTRAQLAMYAAAAVVVVLLGARYLKGAEPPAAPAGGGAGSAAPVRVEQARPAAVVVHVAGAVRRPGVYRLEPGSRIDDALRRAGGATARADLGAVNLAAKAEDGRQVLVPERVPAAGGGGGGGAAGAPGGAGGAAVGGAAGPGGAGAGAVPVNLNTATLEQLDTLPGVGPVTAEKILAYRDEHGGFGSVDELAQVPGIGDKRLATLRDLVGV